jgi:ABC-type transport system substrate-binding protein
MKKATFPIVAILMMTLLLFSPTFVNAYSPRHCKGLDVYFYASDDKAFGALLAGQVDMIQWSVTYEQYLDACSSPDLELAGFSENGMMEFDVNNNYTIADYPGIRSPTNDLEFRRALAQAAPKDYFVNVIINGFAEKLDCPLCAPQKGYGNETCCNNFYPYDIDAANARLDAAGWTDTDSNGIRNYPVGWPGKEAGPDMDCLKVYVRSDHAHRLAAGTLYVSILTDDLHIPVCAVYDTSDVEYPIVMDARNYHIYTGGWNLGRYPTYLWGLFNHDNWYTGGSDYVTGEDAAGNPNYPDLDNATNEVYYATDMTTFTAAVKKSLGLIVCKYCVNIPLWSYRSYWAYSKYLVGVVNEDGYGLENTYTFLNAYKVDNPDTPEDESQQPIKFGTINAPKALNILDSTWYFDYAVLDRLSGSLLSVNPYNLAIDQPWMAQDWYETTWFDPQDNETKTKVTYYIRQDVWWHAPETGEAVQLFTAWDVEFSIWYIYPQTTLWNWAMAKDVHHTVVIDDFTIEIYFDALGMFLKYAPTGPLLPKYLLEPLLCDPIMCELPIVEPILPSDKTILPCDSIVQIINVTKYPEGIPLVEGVDYEVFGTGPPDYCHQEIHWLIPLAPGETIVFWYYAVNAAGGGGYYLGGLDWTNTLYSSGPYYIADFSGGVGGYAILNCVDSHFLGKPPLGEIDWTWYWVAGPYPRSGYYQVNLYDAVALLKAYCARGDACPVPTNWFPGADLDGYDLGHVGLYDAVQLLTNYGKKFGIPPTVTMSPWSATCIHTNVATTFTVTVVAGMTPPYTYIFQVRDCLGNVWNPVQTGASNTYVYPATLGCHLVRCIVIDGTGRVVCTRSTCIINP